jgi:quinoprotein glucose dehydrogenase
MSPTQPVPTLPPPFERQGLLDSDVVDFTPELRAQALEVLKQWDRGPLFTPPTERGAVQLPGDVGGADWGGAGIDPETGFLYVPSLTSPIVVKLEKGDTTPGNMRYRRAATPAMPTLDGIPLYKPPYSRVTAFNLNTGAIAWQVPIGDGPRNHPLLKERNLGPLGNGTRASPLVTRSLLFVSQFSGGLGRATPIPINGLELSDLPPEPPKFRAFDKRTGELVWEKELPLGPAAAPMTYMAGGRQFVVLAVGSGINAELIAFALP